MGDRGAAARGGAAMPALSLRLSLGRMASEPAQLGPKALSIEARAMDLLPGMALAVWQLARLDLASPCGPRSFFKELLLLCV